MHKIVRIRVIYLYESCERHNYHVMAETDEGFDRCVDGHRSGSIYTNFEGLTKEEARDRALCDAHEWGDFLGITPEPFEQDGVIHTPSFVMETYSTRRELKRRHGHD